MKDKEEAIMVRSIIEASIQERGELCVWGFSKQLQALFTK